MTPIVCVFGPTAVGKTAFAIALAKEIGGEIVNADAVQVYRGLDRGSAKPSLAERQGVAHHLLDITDPEMPLSVAVYQSLAQGVLRELERRGTVAVVTGGSGLYLRAALGEWADFGAPPDPAVRLWAAGADAAEIYARALSLDRRAASSLSPNDRPRLVRVIERAQSASGAPTLNRPFRVLKIGLQRPRRELYARIEARSLALWPALLTETAPLLQRRGAAQTLALRTIGYREAAMYLRGTVSQAEALRLLQQSTRHLAKRQLTWWRREPDVIWLRPEDGLAQLHTWLSVLLANWYS